MDAATSAFDDGIPGVFEARQNRSIKSRDGFINAGIEALNSMTLDDLKIAELAKASDNSVGSFYTRFQDKDAYFRALTAYTADGINREFNAVFAKADLRAMTPGKALDALVDHVGAVFSSRYRGVLRETYPRIMEAGDPWEPMRNSARQTLASVHAGLRDAFPQYGRDETETRLSFCFQMIVGVLQNDLVNNYHVYTLEDGSVLVGLKDALRAYMSVPLMEKELECQNIPTSS